MSWCWKERFPTRFNGHPCVVWNYNGAEVTFQQAVQELTAKSIATVCVWGRAPVSAASRRPDPILPERWACASSPAGPRLIFPDARPIRTGWFGRLCSCSWPSRSPSTPTAGPWRSTQRATTGCPRSRAFMTNARATRATQGRRSPFRSGESGHCLQELGCRGPFTKSRCEASWNGIGGHVAPGTHPGHWCVGVNAPCHGCVEKTFPGPESFSELYLPKT